jgi:thiamine biosynthesis lipoprotein
MGSAIHVIVVGAGRDTAEHAIARFADLEARWSRFRSDSEISRANRNGGSFVSVSAETAQLVARALDGWRVTGGLFDPTVLGGLIRAGYDRPIDELRRLSAARSPHSELGSGCAGIELDGEHLRLPACVGFDPGGIGKGLAADIVCAELIELGAAGALVNAGGDLRAIGEGPEGGGWTIGINHPRRPAAVALVGIADGAIATSATLLRSWRMGARMHHHLIDPATGRPAETAVEFASVVAGEAWLAEVWVKALLVGGRHSLAALTESGLSGLIVETSGRVEASAGFEAYLGRASLIEAV